MKSTACRCYGKQVKKDLPCWGFRLSMGSIYSWRLLWLKRFVYTTHTQVDRARDCALNRHFYHISGFAPLPSFKVQSKYWDFMLKTVKFIRIYWGKEYTLSFSLSFSWAKRVVLCESRGRGRGFIYTRGFFYL